MTKREKQMLLFADADRQVDLTVSLARVRSEKWTGRPLMLWLKAGGDYDLGEMRRKRLEDPLEPGNYSVQCVAPDADLDIFEGVSDDVLLLKVFPRFFAEVGRNLPEFGAFAKGGSLTPQRLADIRKGFDAGLKIPSHSWRNVKGVVRKLATVQITREVLFLREF